MIKLSSLLELHQNGRHVVASVRISVRAAVIQVLVEKGLQTLTTVRTFQTLYELFGQLLGIIPIFFPDAITADEQ